MGVFGSFICSEGTKKAGLKRAVTNSGNFPTWAGTKLRKAPGYGDLKGQPGDAASHMGCGTHFLVSMP